MPELSTAHKCGDSGLGYMRWHYDAIRRHQRGERQRYCGRCGRWTWPDLAISGHETLSKREFDQTVRDSKTFVEKHNA